MYTYTHITVYLGGYADFICIDEHVDKYVYYNILSYFYKYI